MLPTCTRCGREPDTIIHGHCLACLGRIVETYVTAIDDAHDANDRLAGIVAIFRGAAIAGVVTQAELREIRALASGDRAGATRPGQGVTA